MYNVSPYFATKTIAEFPITILKPMLTSCILYFGIGLTRSASKFFLFYLSLFLCSLTSQSLGYFLSSIFNQEETAVQLAPIILMPMVLFSGFFSNSGSYPVWISWIQYISPVKYTLEALIYNEFDDRRYDSPIDLISFLGFKLGLFKCLIILLGLTIFFRFVALAFLKLLVGRFQ